MRDIIHLLTGDEAYPPTLDSMVGTYVSKIKMNFETMLWEATNTISASGGSSVVALYEKLPDAARLHLLLSPAVYEALNEFKGSGTAQCFQTIADLVRHECAISEGDAPGVPEDVTMVWAPMGDCAIRRHASGWTRNEFAKIDGLIAVDFDSPYANAVLPRSPLMYLTPEEFTADERSTTIAKLYDAFAYIDRVSPTFAHLIRNFSRAVRLRKSAALGNFAAEHVTSTIGEIRMLNVHKDVVSVSRVAESLLHESVHNLLSTFEFLEHPFVLLPEDRQYRPVSAWTGNPIPVPSLVHAVFVWFALFEFATLELKQPALEPERRAEILIRRNRYASGFVAPMKLTDSLRGLQHYHLSLLPTIDTVQELVRSQFARLQRNSQPAGARAA